MSEISEKTRKPIIDWEYFFKNAEQELSASEIANKFSQCNVLTIYYYAKKYKYILKSDKEKIKNISDNEWLKFFRNLKPNMTINEICSKYNYDYGTIYNRYQKYNYKLLLHKYCNIEVSTNHKNEKKIYCSNKTKWKEFFEKLKPDLTIREICTIASCRSDTAYRYAYEYNYPIYNASVKWKRYFKQACENKTLKEISEECNCLLETSRRNAIKFNYKYFKMTHKSGSLPQFDWNNVNWEDQDVHIAKELGCSRERVRQVRIEKGIDKSPNIHIHISANCHKVKQWLLDNHDLSGTLYRHEILQKLKENNIFVSSLKTSIGKLLKEYNFIPKQTMTLEEWPINWNLPNIDIDKIWKLWYNAAACTRSRMKLHKQKWYGPRAVLVKKSSFYILAIKEEEIVAENHKQYMIDHDIMPNWYKNRC